MATFPELPSEAVRFFMAETPQADAFGTLLEAIGLGDVPIVISGLDPHNPKVIELLASLDITQGRTHVIALFPTGGYSSLPATCGLRISS